METKRTGVPPGGVILRSNVPEEEESLFGYALLTYLPEAEAEADILSGALDDRGIAYRRNPLSEASLAGRSYEDTLALLDGCRRYILVLSDSLEKSPGMPRVGLRAGDAWGEQRVLLNQLWFQIGYLSSRNTERILDADGRERLFCAVAFRQGSFKIESTPGLGTHIDYILKPGEGERLNFLTPKEYADSLAKASPILVRDRFFDGMAADGEELTLSPEKGLARRIGYRRLHLCLGIDRETFLRVAEAIGEDGAGLDRRLSELVCGVHIFRFSKLHSEIDLPARPYRLEAEGAPGEYPPVPKKAGLAPRFAHAVRYIVYGEEKTEGYREYYLDVILPIHKIFGVCFKLYLHAPSLQADVLAALLFPKGEEGATDLFTVDRERNRLWFSLGFEESATARQRLLSGCGERADVLYPR